MEPFNALTKSRYGMMIYPQNDIWIGTSFSLYGEFSEGEVELFRQFVEAGDWVLDIGAHIGSHTVPLAQMVGESGYVAAFEPRLSSYLCLCGNIALNSLTNVIPQKVALGREAGLIGVPAIDLTQHCNSGGVSLSQLEGQRVQMFPLDLIALERLDFVKIDVEGMETDVLAGGEKLIARHRPVLYVENDREEKSEGLLQQLAKMGYRAWWHKVPLYNPKNHFQNGYNAFPGIASFNLLCVHESEEADLTGFEQVL